MNLLILISVSLMAVVRGAPTSQAAKNGALPNPAPATKSTVEDSRRPKMINYFGYYPGYGFGAPSASSVNPAAFINAAGVGAAQGIPGAPSAAAFSPYDFYQFPYGTIAPVYSYNGLLGESDDNYENDVQSTANDVDTGDDYEEDIFSRANRRRPGAGKGGNSRNSPIFYIRLPPTPYMFIRGLGYISNPPTITPLPQPVNPFAGYPNPYQNPYMSMPAANPYMQPSNPFINMPLNFMSNAKPVGVYQYQSPATPAMRFPINGFGPQVNPVRQRPAQSPSNTNSGYNNPDSKITHLKGPFIFNGRPEDIYLLQNLQTTPYNANFFHGYY